MTMTMPDLWPEDIAVESDVLAPATILKQQATLLGQKTQNLVQGSVSSEAHEDEFIHNFYLVAPALGNYKYLLFTVYHPLEFYPLRLQFDATNGVVEIFSQDDFLSALRDVFANEKTKRTIKALLAQSG